jgi:DNA-binding MarR family transcriptional regulator
MANKGRPLRPKSLGRHLNFAAGACTTMCNRMLEAHGLTLAQWVVLAALWQRDDLTVGEIAAYCGNPIPATSRILDRMAQGGLVQRGRDANDRRTVRISLTDKSRALRHLDDFHDRVNRELLNGIDEADVAKLFDLLARVDANARNWRPPE